MNNIIIFSKKILTVSVLLVFLYSCNHASNDDLPVPKIQAGTAKVVGKVINFHREKGDELPVLSLSLPHPITAEIANYQTTLNDDGSFFFEVPLESSPVVGFIRSGIYYGGVCLASGDETQLEIFNSESDSIKVNMKNSLGFTSDDMLMLPEVAIELNKRFDSLKIDSKMNPKEFSTCITKGVDEILKTVVDNNSKLSNQAKQLLSINYQLYLEKALFAYSGNMQFYYFRNPENEEKKIEDFILPPEPGKSYYSFIKELNLNNPQCLYANDYSGILQLILNNDTLQIPAIKDIPVKDWIKGVKTIIANLAGINSGLFYDMLAANAYTKQLKENQPLSEKQKENIRIYFSNPSFRDILFASNKETLFRLDDIEKNKQTNLSINETPSVAKGKLMDAIVSKYKGKVVVFDFWATWCAPCMEAMKEMKPLEGEMKDKNIVFVYITDATSPKELWEKKIQEIGGEHYYLTEEEYKSILSSNQYGFNGIPTYMLFDSNGKLKYKITAYPGNEKMQAMIEELL